MQFRLQSFILSLLVISSYTYSSGQKFTIPIFPDTQVEVGSKPEMFYSQVDWMGAFQFVAWPSLIVGGEDTAHGVRRPGSCLTNRRHFEMHPTGS